MLFPPELAGQEAACPLCGKTITLPKRKRTSVRGVTSAVAVAGCLLTAALIWQHHTKRAGSSPSRSVNDS